jgi:hypothetical protein
MNLFFFKPGEQFFFLKMSELFLKTTILSDEKKLDREQYFWDHEHFLEAMNILKPGEHIFIKE